MWLTMEMSKILSDIAERGYGNPIVCKNYFDVHLKLNLPIYMEYSDHVEITSVFNYQETGETVDSILEKCKVTDAFKRVHSSVMDYQMFPSGTRNAKFSVEVPISIITECLVHSGIAHECPDHYLFALE